MNILKKMKSSLWNFLRNSDIWLIVICILTSGYGVVLVYSVVKTSGASTISFLVQLGASVLGLLLAIIISKLDYEAICSAWPFYAGISLLLVILTFTPLGIAVAGTDDKAWLGIPIGSYTQTFQPAELMKIAFIITFSKHLATVYDHINRPLTLLLLCLHGAVPILLVFKQGDDGTALVFLCMFVAMLFAAGLRPVYFLSAAIAVAAAVPLVWLQLSEDKKARILSLFFVDEFLQTIGYQQAEGLKAMGSGQLWGLGYLEGGSHGLFARNNDFIFTVAGEEFGFVGSILLIAVLAFLIIRILMNAMAARDRLGMFLCIGVMAQIGFQCIINLGMVVRLLPVVGITLPFISQGGSSVATLYLGIALVLSVYHSSRTSSGEAIFSKRL